MKYHGLLLVDKVPGMTSHDVVGRLRRLLNMREIGHAGTLDPLASGLIVALLGEATKLSSYVMDGAKTYRVGLKFGVETDSWDITGKVLRSNSVQLDPERVHSLFLKSQGLMSLKVPAFSAIKSKGKKLYEMAHKGIEVETPTREMDFHSVKTIEILKDSAVVDLVCAKGGYVRSWVHHIGQVLGCGATVESLRRLQSLPYSVDNGKTLDEIEAFVKSEENDLCLDPIGPAFIPLVHTLPGWKTVTVKGRDERLMHNGQVPMDVKRRLIPEQKMAHSEQKSIGVKVVSATSGDLLSIMEATPQQGLKIRRVFRVEDGV